MSHSTPPSTSELKAHDDKLVFKAHNDKANLSRNTKRACAACGSNGSQEKHLKVCTGCKRMWYCSSDCQHTDWKRHKQFCKMHRETQAAMDRDAQTAVTQTDSSSMPSLPVLRDMLEDFVNLHHRMIATVAGHELGARGTTFPPLEVKSDCILLTLKLRDPDANPASIFEFTGGVLPCKINTLDSEKQRMLAPYAARLSDTNIENSSSTGMCLIPVLVRVEQPPFVYMTTIDLNYGQLNPNVLKKTVSQSAPWWAQLEWNAQRGIVVRRHWDDRAQSYVELMGTLKQKEDSSWRFEKAENSRGNQKAQEELRERKKLLKK